GSTVGSVLGNVSMTAGENLMVQGSDVLAGKDISLTGKNVSILAAENQSSQTHTVEQKSSGLTLALSGTVGSAANTAVTTAKAASDESNGRLAALQGVKAALSGVQAVQGGQLATLDASDQNAIGVSLSYGSQSSKSEQTVNQTTHQGSTLTAGNNLNITATGNGVKGQDGDIVVQGSQLQAGKDTSLTANRDVILQSTQESQTLDGSNSSSGGSLGVGIGAGQGGWGINVSASLNKGKGSESGNGVSYTETTVNAGNQLNITSGRDTVLQGAQVSGETVKADVGRDLLLQSQQDSDRYDSKQQDGSVGGSFNFGSMTGSASINASQDKMHSNFDSVQEQTGIFAGKGGFDITVGEHTQLDGAVIASTADKNRNSLDTGTLGFSDIENKADFKVEHQSVGISTGGNIGGQFAGNMANGLLVGANNEGHADGITHAAVSDGTLTIRDTEKQQQNVDDLSRDVEHANNALSPIFDKEKEQTRLREAQLIGEIGSQVSDVIRTQGQIIATKAANEKMLDVSEKDKVDAKAQWEKANPGKVATAEDINGQVYKTAYDQAFNASGYGTGGKFQQAAQAATAAIQGLAGGDMAKALAGASAPYLAEVIHNMTTDPVTGKVNTEANLMAHAVLGAVMAQINGNNALSGASGALMGEFIAQQLYPDIPRNELSEEQKQTISALGTLAAGLAGGLTGDSTADAVAGAQAGKNALENNNLAILRTGAAACAEIAVCSKAVIDLGFGALIGVGVATSAIEELSGVQKTNVMLAAMSGDQEQIDKLSPSERAAYEELKNSKGLITVFPTPVDDPTGGKLINPAPDQNKGTALVTPDKSGENGATNTGNMDGKPNTGGNTTSTPVAEQDKDDLAYTSEGSRPANLSPEDAGRTGAFNEAKRQSGIPVSQSPDRVLPNVDKRGNPQPGQIYEFDVPKPGGGTQTIQIRDDAGGHFFGEQDTQNRGSHFNDAQGNHYDY
uniref:hemagglutinin repeat-containing protein n=1 Tax=Yersinia alsatica TaxID=2890317 RepID=UPI0016437517